jgi:hypothetical protein
MTKKPDDFKSALSYSSRTIAHLYSRIEQQKLVLQRIHQVLPLAIAEHTLHCVVNGKKLLIYTDTAAWASQLRFYNLAILDAIAPVTKETVSIVQIKTGVKTLLATPSRRMPNIPSAKNIDFIRDHSMTVADEQLKEALLKLSSTLTKLSKRKARTD